MTIKENAVNHQPMSNEDIYYLMGHYEGQRQHGLPYPTHLHGDEGPEYIQGWLDGYNKA